MRHCVDMRRYYLRSAFRSEDLRSHQTEQAGSRWEGVESGLALDRARQQVDAFGHRRGFVWRHVAALPPSWLSVPCGSL